MARLGASLLMMSWQSTSPVGHMPGIKGWCYQGGGQEVAGRGIEAWSWSCDVSRAVDTGWMGRVTTSTHPVMRHQTPWGSRVEGYRLDERRQCYPDHAKGFEPVWCKADLCNWVDYCSSCGDLERVCIRACLSSRSSSGTPGFPSDLHPRGWPCEADVHLLIL